MPASHRIIITAEALTNLDRIASYIHRKSPQNALAVSRAILDAIDSLVLNADRVKKVGASRSRSTPVHGMVVRPYIVYYRVEPVIKTVYILHIRHEARRQPKRFK